MVVTPHPGSFGGALVRRRAREPGAAPPGRRGGAPGGAAPFARGRNASQAFRAGRSQGFAPRGPRKPPGASRRSIPSRGEGRKKGKDAPASIKTGPAELG